MVRLGMLVAAAALLALAACTTVPIVNINQTPIVSSNPNLTPEQVGNAIMRAGATLGWAMQADRPAHILATLHLHGHVAIVDINYDTRFYSITYKDSSDLEYDGQNILKSYNRWVRNLNKQIKIEISRYK